MNFVSPLRTRELDHIGPFLCSSANLFVGNKLSASERLSAELGQARIDLVAEDHLFLKPQQAPSASFTQARLPRNLVSAPHSDTCNARSTPKRAATAAGERSRRQSPCGFPGPRKTGQN
jgi:hypothetical protein